MHARMAAQLPDMSVQNVIGHFSKARGCTAVPNGGVRGMPAKQGDATHADEAAGDGDEGEEEEEEWEKKRRTHPCHHLL